MSLALSFKAQGIERLDLGDGVQENVLKELSKVSNLNLSYNRMRNLDSNMKKCFSGLRELNLKHNLLQDIHGIPPRLKILDLSNNRLLNLSGLEDCRNLVKLYLRKNLLSTTHGITHLSKLEILDLSHNQILSIGVMSGIPKLKELDLGRNKLGSFESLQNLSTLKRLTKLTLEDNPVATLASYEFTMTSLLPSLVILDGEVLSINPTYSVHHAKRKGHYAKKKSESLQQNSFTAQKQSDSTYVNQDHHIDTNFSDSIHSESVHSIILTKQNLPKPEMKKDKNPDAKSVQTKKIKPSATKNQSSPKKVKKKSPNKSENSKKSFSKVKLKEIQHQLKVEKEKCKRLEDELCLKNRQISKLQDDNEAISIRLKNLQTNKPSVTKTQKLKELLRHKDKVLLAKDEEISQIKETVKYRNEQIQKILGKLIKLVKKPHNNKIPDDENNSTVLQEIETILQSYTVNALSRSSVHPRDSVHNSSKESPKKFNHVSYPKTKEMSENSREFEKVISPREDAEDFLSKLEHSLKSSGLESTLNIFNAHELYQKADN